MEIFLRNRKNILENQLGLVRVLTWATLVHIILGERLTNASYFSIASQLTPLHGHKLCSVKQWIESYTLPRVWHIFLNKNDLT